jgi:hypothetical protein
MSATSNLPVEHVEHLTTLTKAKGFLGREFLTWLWYVAETSSDIMSVQDEEGKKIDFDLWVDDRLVLESSSAQTHSNVMKGGDPSQSHEAAAGLVTGKTVRELKLGVNIRHTGEFTAVLACDDLSPRSLKLPNPSKPDNLADPDDLPILTRIKYTETFLTVLDGLFARFLTLRVEDHWETASLKAMRDWVKQRSSTMASSLH